jgi:hypothetical protein
MMYLVFLGFMGSLAQSVALIIANYRITKLEKEMSQHD